MPWQKSSYCGEGESCVHVAESPDEVHITESADPSGAILTAAPADFGALLAVLKEETRQPAPIEVAFGDGDVVRLRAGAGGVVTTTRSRWDAFVLGVRAGEFDRFAG
ncbi:DUF397 domain-containing protein [Streptomyces sp. NPDC047028]|uniref:DUF397 domain-containing protein n=1 Tax=Streptomyces sp. NPDC047028 TaxID=3155793 RepID=UPI0033E08100